jgi:hypothetical protein
MTQLSQETTGTASNQNMIATQPTQDNAAPESRTLVTFKETTVYGVWQVRLQPLLNWSHDLAIHQDVSQTDNSEDEK